MNKTRIRTTLFIGAAFIVLVALVFLLILNLNQSEELKRTFLTYLIVLFVFSSVAFAVFFYKGAIFKISGELEEGLVITIILTVLIVVQITFAFANYAYRQMQNSFQAFDNARVLYAKIDWNSGPRSLDEQLAPLPDDIDLIYITNAAGNVVYHHGSLALKAPDSSTAITRYDVDYPPNERFIFPFEGGTIGMHISKTYTAAITRSVLLDLSTLVIVGLFFGFELILLVMQFIKRKIAEYDTKPGMLANTGFFYIRQLAFFFYFASRMASAFIPVLASQLTGNASGGIASSMPQSAETLLTCAAIFLTSEMIIRKGWKVPFLAGLCVVVVGTFLSGIANSLPVFIIARAIVGLGYGFCWMTLRNMALLGRDDSERNYGFALMNAGLYAGMNCGSVVGSILAGVIGYENVFFIAAGITALCVLLVLGLQNGGMQQSEGKQETAASLNTGLNKAGDFIPVAGFLLLLILPTCIIGAYTKYFLPVYTVGIGLGTADVGRAQLLYGLIIVYCAPKLTLVIKKRMGSGIGMNILYNLLLATALVITGIFGGFSVALLAVLFIALGDGFGFGAQNNYFLALPAMARMPESRSLSYLSFLKKLAEMTGPITFALMMIIPNRKGILIMGILFGVMALIASRITWQSPDKQG